MGVLLILAQVVLIVLRYGTHTIHVSPWLVFLPVILFATLWLIACLLGATFAIDRFGSPYVPSQKPAQRPAQRRRR